MNNQINLEYSKDNPFIANILKAKYLTTSDSLKRCLHVEIDISNSNINYQPGDVFGIICSNNKKEVKKLLERLHVDPEQNISLTNQNKILFHFLKTKKENFFSIFSIFLYSLDIHSIPKKNFLKTLAEYTKDNKQKERLLFLSSKDGSKEYLREMASSYIPTLLEILLIYDSCYPPIEKLIDMLPPLQPRYYSVTSSPILFPDKIHIAFNIIEYTNLKGEKRMGLCTSWLEKLCKPLLKQNYEHNSQNDIKIPIFKRESKDFKLPSSLDIPIIMIGPGTGVAPFKSFIQHRYELSLTQKETLLGLNWLFFGCRHEKKDFIYKEDFEEMVKKDILRLTTAFSRDQVNKIYVQTRIEEYGEEIVKLMMESNAKLYLCGDTKGMLQGVNSSLITILTKYADMDRQQAQQLITKWMKEKKYIIDIWS